MFYRLVCIISGMYFCLELLLRVSWYVVRIVPNPSQSAMSEKKSLFYPTLERKFSVLVSLLRDYIIRLDYQCSRKWKPSLFPRVSLPRHTFPYQIARLLSCQWMERISLSLPKRTTWQTWLTEGCVTQGPTHYVH